ncbi:hypothetical protein HYT01_03405 [Candidatus Giovannonibacteria bacterium]|nr:hypothetical protein [Candidatus Giovannonibacteria bacterium]
MNKTFIVSAAVLGLLFCILPLSVRAQTNIPVPVISVIPAQYYPMDEVLYMEGKAKPDSKVDIFFEKYSGGAAPIKITVEANDAGEWFLNEDLDLPSGEWMVRARHADPQGDWSNPRILRSINSGFTVFGITVKYLPLAISVFIFIIAGFGLILYSFLRIQSVKRLGKEHASHEMLEAAKKIAREKEKEAIELVVEKGFVNVKRDIELELDHLNSKLKAAGDLLPEEFDHRDKLLRELSKLEQEIDKKVRDLDGI